ncbi:MAG: amidohydrolase family protein [Bacteroidales bacterium]|nr:amidohydrolase family protein [Bacteroidales bacterium]
MSIILKNTRFINWETLRFSNAHLKVEKGTNGGLSFFDSFDEILISPNDEIIDCKGKFVSKSFAIGHHHAYSALARGMPAPEKSPANFLEILKYIWWKLDKALDKEIIEASALATAMACAKAGATFIIDHHASPNSIKGSLDVIARAFEKIGVNHLLCYEITDRDGLEKAKDGLRETADYLSTNQGLVGLHASFTVGDDTLKKATELMKSTSSGIHIHVAEAQSDQEQCVQKHGKRIVERLSDFGALDSAKTILAHCLHINENERELIRASKAFVVQNTESNLNNKVGYFQSRGLGERIMLGTDGMHSDMLRNAKAAYFVGQANDEIDFAAAYNRFRKVHHYLNTNNFSGDGENNLLVLDYNSPTEMNEGNFLGHFIFGLTSNHVQHVISDGKLIVKDSIIQTINEEEVLKFTREQANRLWSRMLKVKS